MAAEKPVSRKPLTIGTGASQIAEVAKKLASVPLRRVRTESSSSEDEAADLIPRRSTGGKEPSLASKNPALPEKEARLPGRRQGKEVLKEAEALSDSLEERAIKAGAAVEPFSEEAYLGTISAEIERRASGQQGAEEETGVRKRKADGQAVGEGEPKRANVKPTDLWRQTLVALPESVDIGTTEATLPLFPSEYLAEGFCKFVDLTLNGGFHEKKSGLIETAVLSMHASHLAFRAAHEEAVALAKKEKAEKLIESQAAQLEEYKKKLDFEEKQCAELKRKAADVDNIRASLKKLEDENKKEKASRIGDLKKMAGIEAELSRAKVEKAEILKERAVREEGLMKEAARRESALKKEASERENSVRKELRRAEDEVNRQRERNKRLEGEKARAVKEYRSSPAFEKEQLLIKREAFLEGLASNVRIFNHYGCLDFEKYEEGRKDPALRESVPAETYADQWAHLEEEGDDSDKEVSDDCAIIEGGSSQAAPDDQTNALTLVPFQPPEKSTAETEVPGDKEAAAAPAP